MGFLGVPYIIRYFSVAYFPREDLQESISPCNAGANTKFAVLLFEFEINTPFDRNP